MKKILKSKLLTKITSLLLIITILIFNFCFITNAATATSGGRTYTTDSGARISAKSVSSDFSASINARKPDAASWYRTQAGLWYYFENDRITTKRGWFNDATDGQTYYLDPDTGIMLVGWVLIDGNYYYFNESHNNENNWKEVGNGFFESLGKKVKAYGSMFRDEYTPDGKKVDASGRLIEGNKDDGSNKQKFNKTLVNEYNSLKPNCKFDEEGNLWIYGASYLDTLPGEGITIKYADGKTKEYYEWTGAAGATHGHFDQYNMVINGKRKESSGYDGEGGGEVGDKVRSIFKKYFAMQDSYK